MIAMKKRSDPDIRFVFTIETLNEALEWLLDSVLIAEDIETLPEMVLMNVIGFAGLHADGRIRTYVFTLYRDKHPSSGLMPFAKEIIEACQRINASGIPIAFQNGSYDLFWLVRYRMPVANYAYDSMTMAWAAYPELPKRLDFISSIYLDDYVYWKGDRKSDNFLTYLRYNGLDCDRTLHLVIHLISEMIEKPQARMNFWAAHSRVISCLAMSMRGMVADEKRLAEHGVELEAKAVKAEEELRYLVADPAFNHRSPAQRSHLIYVILGAKPRNAKGRYVNRLADASTGQAVLRAIRSESPILRRVVNGIVAAAEPAKQISNVIGIKRAPWGRCYTAYAGTGTTTTRLSSSESPLTYGTNLQNLRKDYRDWLVADDEDSFLLDVDLSAGDDVFVSFESGDPKKIDLFRSGRDAHAANATIFFPHWEYDSVVAGKNAKDPRVVHPITGIRQISKKLSHGCNYLMAALTLLITAGREAIVGAAKEVGFDQAGVWTQAALAEFCESREELYREAYHRFQRFGEGSWYMDLQKEVIDTGGFTTPFNYYQRFLGDPYDQSVLRAVAATAGQAGTAGRINMAMDEFVHGIIHPRFRDSENPHYGREALQVSRELNGVSLRLQTHDSFTFNVTRKHPDWREGVSRIFEVMARPVVIRNSQTGGLEEFSVRLEAEVGRAWGPGLKGVGLTVSDVEQQLEKMGI